VRPIRRIKVFSPNPEHRRAFARMAADALGIAVEAPDSAEEVVRGSDIVAACTNTRQPVVFGDWLQPGAHVIPVQLTDELDEGAWRRIDRLVRYQSPPGVQGTACDQLWTYRPDAETVRRIHGGSTPEFEARLLQWVGQPKMTELTSLLLGKAPGRQDEREITCAISEGTGVQFAAVGLRVYEEAKRRGLGRRLPLEWFLQDVTN
jgi:ornithine cyclodeaminase/alanine dehydrogenase-like protein (mu-crystallin family)